MSDGKKKPRKISCLPCRAKKARCDALLPHCNRCIRNSRENQCIYPKPRTFGRPPKNAVFHKNQDLVISSIPPTKKQEKEAEKIQCREFVFEQLQSEPSRKANQVQRCIKYNNQILDIERIFSLYIARASFLRQKLGNFKLNPRSKLKTLQQHFTWLTGTMVNIAIRRACQLVELESFVDPEITITAFLRREEKSTFFFNSSYDDISSPLNSIPTDQAIQLIDQFFELHPYRVILNKTKLLHDYWNDSIEPLLLCVVYGVAIYTCQQTTKGDTFKLWEAQRNPFLNYAYVLIEKFFIQRDKSGLTAPSPSSLGNYQACVILGIFEALFGLSKHGMTIVSLSYMMASDLGIFSHSGYSDHVLDGDGVHRNGQTKIHYMDSVDKEQLINTYWAALRATAYGCVELGLYLRESLLFHGQPFPPANASTSTSYQFDLANNNHSLSTAYLIESFHTEMVVAYFSSKLFSCLPKVEYNLFGCKVEVEKPLDVSQQDHQLLLQLLKASSSHTYTSETECKIKLVLKNFSDFIERERHQWSLQQLFTIESTYYLYSIHFSFLRPSYNVVPIRNQEFIPELDLKDKKIASRIANLLPTTLLLTTLLKTFLEQNEDRVIHDPKKEPQDSHPEAIASLLLPYGLMSMTLETIVQLTIFHYKLGISSMDQIKSAYAIVRHRLFWMSQQQATTKLIYRKLQNFFRLYQVPINYHERATDDTQNASSIITPVPPSFVSINPTFYEENQDFNAFIEPSSYLINNEYFTQGFDTLFQDVFDGLY
ncbi:uncharacterized protein B0P05DRAFT_572237 [Gilbertella persicaria]|uniref:uncharacterized protein n=1 Tax=Gilbertella persicaria TaxID=101096 RepID=UPI00221F6A97|nr:uncharacterized protein B0P05DRAFT_572237 [Gilbertella persicaria]KAI8076566.1 hypothetical protein B0P05DRAFT_572237 [Gilbertella persicaria]